MTTTRPLDRPKHLLTIMILGLIGFYRLVLSPLFGANCRHFPTCSQYAKDAVIEHGPLHGSLYALKRILRCHPLAEPAHDPVPPSVARARMVTRNKADKGEG